MKNKYLIIMSAFLLFMISANSSVIAADIIIVANKNVKQSQLSKDEIKFIFLGRKKKWDDDARIIFVVYKSKDYQEEFMQDFLGRTPEQFDHYWKQNVFTGNGQMPTVFDKTEDLVDFISNTEASIGYLPSDAHIGNLKIIKIEQD